MTNGLRNEGNCEMRVFLSYSTDDRQLARRLHTSLEQVGSQVWDEAQLVPGAKWQEQVEEAIHSADIFVVLIGPHWTNHWVQRETSAALARAAEEPGKLRIVPVFLPGVDRARVPPSIQNYLGLDLTNARNIEHEFARLAASLAKKAPWLEETRSESSATSAPRFALTRQP